MLTRILLEFFDAVVTLNLGGLLAKLVSTRSRLQDCSQPHEAEMKLEVPAWLSRGICGSHVGQGSWVADDRLGSRRESKSRGTSDTIVPSNSNVLLLPLQRSLQLIITA